VLGGAVLGVSAGWLCEDEAFLLPGKGRPVYWARLCQFGCAWFSLPAINSPVGLLIAGMPWLALLR